MATLSTNKKTGAQRILFVDRDGKRRILYCGDMSKTDAQFFKYRVESLVGAQAMQRAPEADVARWLGEVGDDVYSKLVGVGLVEKRDREAVPTVDAFIRDYLAERADLKPATLTLMGQGRVWLVRHLGESLPIDAVTTADADAYRARMVKAKLAKATIAKRCRYARHYFAVALRRKLVRFNPFEHIKGQVVGNPARREFVPGDVVQRVVDHVPCPQWKLLIALARWGGLRIPSEAFALAWRDVDFKGKRFIVRSSKTEHHDDGGIRVVPMFPELADHFQAAFDAAPEGSEHVITRYRDSLQNIRTQFARYITAAGVQPWGKLWQNLRASRATELADQYPSHVCAAWLGHTEKIADAFYRMTTDAHFDKAVFSATRQTTRAGAELGGIGVNVESVTVSENITDTTGNTVFSGDAGTSTDAAGMGGTGVEPATSTM
ncbi:MAG: site-specific integrase [Planctomycetes bacterium]|nr:site-specific integrase [Planctomycetota bacterium]